MKIPVITFLLLAPLSFGQTPEKKTLAELVRERLATDPPTSSEEKNAPEPEPTTPPETITPPEEPPPSSPPTEAPSPTAPSPQTPEPTEIPPTPEPTPEPPASKNTTEPHTTSLPDHPLASDHYKIKSGDTLGRVASKLYGSTTFSTLLQNYNKVDPRRLRIGQDLKTPSLATFVQELGSQALSTFPEEMRLLLELQYDYHQFEDQFSSSGLSDETKKALETLMAKTTLVQEGLSKGNQAPTKSLSQLKSFQQNLQRLHEGTLQPSSSRGRRSRTHLAIALTEAIAWTP